MSAPSAWKIEQVMAVAIAFIARLREFDADIASDEDALACALTSETDALDVLEQVVRFALDSKASAAATEARIADLQARRDRFKRREADARGAAYAMMDALGISKHSAADFTISVRPGTPHVVITDETLLPPNCFRTVRSVDKSAVTSALKAGDVPGAEWANSAPVLTIRTK